MFKPTSSQFIAGQGSQLSQRTSPRIAVIGAGIVGSCIAFELRKRGAEVTLIDRDEPGRGCSYGNSGAISVSSVAPLAMPGLLASLPGMLFDRDSPLSLRLGYLPKALPWLSRFLLAASADTAHRSAAQLAALHAGALSRHEALAAEVGVPDLFMQRGHLHLYPNEEALAKDAGGWRLREQHGFRAERLARDGIVALEPNVGARYTVGMYLADHATIRNPLRYVQAVVQAFTARGGVLCRQAVRAVVPLGGQRWRIEVADTAEPPLPEFDHVVVAAGVWSGSLLGPLGLHLPLESQRGYHVQFEGMQGLVSRTVVLADRKVFVTPMEHGLRAGGTVEIAGLSLPPDMRRAATLERYVRETFAGLEGASTSRWMGHRPCMPDSVPVIGPAAKHPGLWLAVGHGHLGLTDSVTTAQRIADGVLNGREAASVA